MNSMMFMREDGQMGTCRILQARWDLIDKNEKKDEEVDPQSQEEKDMTLDCIQAELDCVEKYTDEKFNDSKLQEYAVKYVNLLKQHKDVCKYILFFMSLYILSYMLGCTCY